MADQKQAADAALEHHRRVEAVIKACHGMRADDAVMVVAIALANIIGHASPTPAEARGAGERAVRILGSTIGPAWTAAHARQVASSKGTAGV